MVTGLPLQGAVAKVGNSCCCCCFTSARTLSYIHVFAHFREYVIHGRLTMLVGDHERERSLTASVERTIVAASTGEWRKGTKVQKQGSVSMPMSPWSIGRKCRATRITRTQARHAHARMHTHISHDIHMYARSHAPTHTYTACTGTPTEHYCKLQINKGKHL